MLVATSGDWSVTIAWMALERAWRGPVRAHHTSPLLLCMTRSGRGMSG